MPFVTVEIDSLSAFRFDIRKRYQFLPAEKWGGLSLDVAGNWLVYNRHDGKWYSAMRLIEDGCPLQVWEEETLPLPSGDSPQLPIAEHFWHGVFADHIALQHTPEAEHVIVIPSVDGYVPERFTHCGAVYEIKRVATPNTEEERR